MDKKPDPLAPATLHELADMHIAVTGKYLHEVAAKLDACDLERRTYSDAMAALQSKLGESQIRVAALEAQVRKLLDARVCEECEWPVGSEQHKQHCPEAIRG